MGFLYYIEGFKRMPSPQDFKNLNLGYDGCSCDSFCQTDIGPDLKGGIIFTIKGKTSGKEKIGYYHSEQEWVNVPDSKLWVGYNINNKPKPEDFAKTDQLDGYRIKLEDGNEWLIPLARRFDSGCNLPKVMTMLVEDKISYVTASRCIPLQKIADKLLCLFPWRYTNEEEQKRDFLAIAEYKTQFKMCVEILMVNYNLNRIEISILGLLSTSNTLEIFKLLVDFPTAEDLENGLKKKVLSVGLED